MAEVAVRKALPRAPESVFRTIAIEIVLTAALGYGLYWWIVSLSAHRGEVRSGDSTVWSLILLGLVLVVEGWRAPMVLAARSGTRLGRAVVLGSLTVVPVALAVSLAIHLAAILNGVFQTVVVVAAAVLSAWALLKVATLRRVVGVACEVDGHLAHTLGDSLLPGQSTALSELRGRALEGLSDPLGSLIRLEGGWGSGKTRVLKALEQDLRTMHVERLRESCGLRRVIPIYFDVWEHDAEVDLYRAIVLRILASELNLVGFGWLTVPVGLALDPLRYIKRVRLGRASAATVEFGVPRLTGQRHLLACLRRWRRAETGLVLIFDELDRANDLTAQRFTSLAQRGLDVPGATIVISYVPKITDLGIIDPDRAMIGDISSMVASTYWSVVAPEVVRNEMLRDRLDQRLLGVAKPSPGAGQLQGNTARGPESEIVGEPPVTPRLAADGSTELGPARLHESAQLLAARWVARRGAGALAEAQQSDSLRNRLFGTPVRINAMSFGDAGILILRSSHVLGLVSGVVDPGQWRSRLADTESAWTVLVDSHARAARAIENYRDFRALVAWIADRLSQPLPYHRAEPAPADPWTPGVIPSRRTAQLARAARGMLHRRWATQPASALNPATTELDRRLEAVGRRAQPTSRVIDPSFAGLGRRVAHTWSDSWRWSAGDVVLRDRLARLDWRFEREERAAETKIAVSNGSEDLFIARSLMCEVLIEANAYRARVGTEGGPV